MSYRNLNTGLIFRLLIFALLVAAFTLSVYFHNWNYGIHALFFLGLSLWNLLSFVNGVNRKLSFFFEAIANGDNSLFFPENVKNKSLLNLHKNLNKVNQLLSEFKIKRENRERLFMEFMRQSETGFMVINEEGHIEIINPKAEQLIDLNAPTQIHQLSLSNPKLYQTLIHFPSGTSQTIKWIKDQQTRQISLKMVLIYFEGKKYKIYSINDIKSEMEENELESWLKFIRITTHEIMNSIAPITSLSNTLSRFFVQNGKRKSIVELNQKVIDDTIKGLTVIEERADGLHHFVDNYRKLSKIPEPIFKAIKLNEWLQNIELLVLKKLKKEDIQLDIIYQQEKTSLLGDEKLLSQVLLNLLNNSLEALRGMNHKRIKLYISESHSQKLMIKIEDNGCGFSPEALENLFIPFYTTKTEGSGIGLSLSRQIMRLHKGRISAQSIPGQKTTFELIF